MRMHMHYAMHVLHMRNGMVVNSCLVFFISGAWVSEIRSRYDNNRKTQIG
jgi:hypothetical protein